MTNYTGTIVQRALNSTEFNNWGAAIDAALTGIGLTKVADTGAVVTWGAQTRPAAGNVGPFEIWRLDTPTTGAPEVYLRLNYGVHYGNGGVLLTCQIGTGSDGAGTLTGPGSAVGALTVINTSGDTATRNVWASSDGDGFTLACGYDSTTTKFLLVIDRQRTAAGLAEPNAGWNPTGYMRIVYNPSAHNVQFVDVESGDAPTATTKWPAISGRTVSGVTSLINAGSEMTMWPVMIPGQQGLYWSKMLIAFPVNDANVGTDLAVDHLGATRTWRSLGATISGTDHLNNTGASCGIWWSD